MQGTLKPPIDVKSLHNSLNDYALSFLTMYEIEKSDDITITVDQFELGRTDYQEQEQFDKTYLLLVASEDMILLLALESAVANFLLQARYGGCAGESSLWNAWQADSFSHFCNRIAADLISRLRLHKIDVPRLSTYEWQSSVSDLLEENVTLLSVHSLVLSLGSHKAALQLIAAQRPSGIAFEDVTEASPAPELNAKLLNQYVQTIPITITFETRDMHISFSKLLRMKIGDMLPFNASDICIKMNNQTIGQAILGPLDRAPTACLQSLVLPTDEMTYAS
jgi:flagellar motor switch/type III secretory pathway protein FliN